MLQSRGAKSPSINAVQELFCWAGAPPTVSSPRSSAPLGYSTSPFCHHRARSTWLFTAAALPLPPPLVVSSDAEVTELTISSSSARRRAWRPSTVSDTFTVESVGSPADVESVW